ncbi:Thioesterase superfamily protein [anaerobic digester metagenome]
MAENSKQNVLRKEEASGFIRRNGIKVVSIEEDRCILEAEITPESENIWGIVHGGLIYTMADTAAGALVRSHMGHGEKNVTVNASINYYRAAKDVKKLIAVSRERKGGHSIGFYEVDITDENGVLIASAQITMYFLRES